ncbi:MAG TPA: helix-turn-helix domain-containing protein [Acidobacteriaceae bacterium]|nr:helix-turn-helix domain-containing protein [Acidobacteriaceae bacterium]
MRPISEPHSTAKTPAKRVPQARRIATNARILDAALEVFSELGFENAQLDQVAARAGCSRGAIYAQYTSKEEVFLALIQNRIHTRFTTMLDNVQMEPVVGKRLPIMRSWIIAQACDHSWGTLMLEFKLYVVRRPEAIERLLKLYDTLFYDQAKDLPELLFGKGLSRSQRRSLDQRMAVLGSALSGMVLESHFRPSLFPPKQLQKIAGELFDALVHL